MTFCDDKNIPVRISSTDRGSSRPLQRGHFVTKHFLADAETYTLPFCRVKIGIQVMIKKN